MFQKLVVAFNHSSESERALATGIHLAKTLGAELHTITVMADLPAYTAFAVAGGESSQALREDQRKSYENLKDKARSLAARHGVEPHSHLIEGGREVESIVDFLGEHKADLLVIGLHQRDFYIARLWSTVYELAQAAPCSVLGVH
jgi:nucleotide-binding universal stress UspA family protein